MRHIVTAAVLMAIVSGVGTSIAHAWPSATTTPAAEIGRIDDYLRDRMEASGTPGMAYAIVSSNAVEHVATLGVDGDGDPVTEATPFLWGSVAKPVTATAIMTLVEDGSVDLDALVVSYLPSFTLADRAASDRITVRHLLEQTSGIPEGTGITDRFGRRENPYTSAVADLADAEPVHPAGEQWEYTSANYLVLGAVVEAVTGRSYEEYLHEAVLEPLEMTGAITSPSGAEADLPPGHRFVFGRAAAVNASYDPTGPSYGYLGGTVRDLARFAMAHLAGGRFGQSQVLTEATVKTMHTGTARVNDTQSYGLGWRDDLKHADTGGRTVFHIGGVTGYQTMLFLLPDLDRGIVVMQNAYGFFQDTELAAAGFGAARILAGGEPSPPDNDATYPLILTVLVALVILLIGLTARTLRLLRRTARPHRRARTVVATMSWVVGAVALAWLAGVGIPMSAETTLGVMPLFAPDVAWLLIAVIVASLALAAVRLAVGVIRLRRSPA